MLCLSFAIILPIRADKADHALYLPWFCRHDVMALCAQFLLRFCLQQMIKQIVQYICGDFAVMSWRHIVLDFCYVFAANIWYGRLCTIFVTYLLSQWDSI